MKLVVKFIEEPPVTYAPKVDKFEVVRCNSSGHQDDEGQYIATTIKLSIGNSAGLSGAQCRIYYKANGYPEVDKDQYVDVLSKVSMNQLISGVNFNTSILSGVWNLGSVWNFAVVFIAGEETAVATDSAARGTTSLHISDYPGGGAAVGGFSTGTKNSPKFESHVPSYFYDGIHGVTSYTLGEIETGGKWIDGKKIYRSVIQFNLSATNSATNIATLPAVSSVIRIYGKVTRNNEQQFPPFFWFASDNYHSIFVNTATTVMAKSSHAISGHVIIEYTKMTD